jgi:hypothetical protein
MISTLLRKFFRDFIRARRASRAHNDASCRSMHARDDMLMRRAQWIRCAVDIVEHVVDRVVDHRRASRSAITLDRVSRTIPDNGPSSSCRYTDCGARFSREKITALGRAARVRLAVIGPHPMFVGPRRACCSPGENAMFLGVFLPFATGARFCRGA